MYVDNFYLFLTDQNGSDIVDPIYSILGGGTFSSGLYSHERALLEYCSRNHITHLILYDLPNLFATADYVLNSQNEQGDVSLCRFMIAAKNDYCIETFSAAVSQDLQADQVITQNIQFSPIVLTPGEISRIGNSTLINAIQSIDSLITDTIIKKDIDLLRFTVTMDRFNGPVGCPDFDFFAAENEFWNNGIGEYNQWRAMVTHITSISTIPIEGYTFEFEIQLAGPSDPTSEDIRDVYDGTSSTNRNIARTLATHYTNDTEEIQDAFNLGRTRTINHMLKDASTPGHSIILPIFSAESSDLSPIVGGANYVGEWIIDPYTTNTSGGIDPVISRNIFSVEKYYYDDWRYNSHPDVSTNLLSPLENVIKPGSSVWLNSSLMMKYFDNQTIFYRAGVYGCLPIGSSTTVNFNYCGPIDPGTNYIFTLTHDGTNGYSQNTGILTIDDLALNPYNIINHPDAISPISFTNVPSSTVAYTAKLELVYVNNQGAACGSYIYTQKIYVSNTLMISSTGDINPTTHKMCEGSSATLFANYSSSNPNEIEWYLDGIATGTFGSFIKIPITLSAGSHTYYYKVTSSPAPSCGIQSQNFIVIVNSNPKIAPISFNCSGFPGQIYTSSSYSNAIYLWSDGFTTASRPIPQSEYISVQVTNQGGCSRIIKSSLPSKPKIVVTGTCSFTATVDPVNTSGIYSWFKYNPVTNSWAAYGTSGTSIANLPPGKYGCKIALTLPTRCMFSTFTVGGAITSVDQTNASCATGNIGAITIGVEGTSSPYTYMWSHCSTCTTETVTGLAVGTYTCTVTDINNCSSSASVSITSDNPCQTQSLQICDGTNISTILSSYTPGMSVAVHGELILDQNFTFDASDITFDENSKITVEPGVELTITNSCTLRVCPQFIRWEGIVLTDGTSKLNVNGSSIIRDAEVAVDANSGVLLTIENSFFINNLISFSLRDGNFSTSLFRGNEFFSGNTDITLEEVICHIDLKNVTSVTIGDIGISSTKNMFSHSLYAIRSESSSAVIQNNEFFELGKKVFNDSYNWVTNGGAIHAFGGLSDIEIRGTSTVQDMNYFHDITGVGVDIYENRDLEIYGNLFSSVYVSIQIIKDNGRSINVHSNEFKNFYAGIALFDVSQSNISILENKFNMITTDFDPLLSEPEDYLDVTYYGTVAIDIQSAVGSALQLEVKNNWISNVKYGIHLRNIAATVMDDVLVWHNQIFFTIPANVIFISDKGIWMENSSKCKISNNHIRSFNGVPVVDYAAKMVGIEFTKSTECLIKENYLGNLGRGIYGLYSCLSTTLHCNNFENYYNGVQLFRAVLPTQGSTGISYDNEWYNGSTGGLRIAGGIGNGGFLNWHHNGTTPQLLNSSNVSLAIFPVLAGNPDDCTTPTISSPMEMREQYYEKTAYDLSTYALDAEFNDYYEKILYYTGLKENPELLTLGTPDDIVYQTLYNNLNEGNIGKFEQVSDLLRSKDFSAANILINSLIDENIVEQYKKTVSQIYIDKELGQRELTATEKSALESIAYELGVYGGEAVYMARAMLKIFVDEDLTFARRSVPEFYTNKKINKNKVKESIIFPNPTSNEFSILLSGKNDKTLYVFNSFGTLVKSMKLSKDLTIFTLNVEDLEPVIIK